MTVDVVLSVALGAALITIAFLAVRWRRRNERGRPSDVRRAQEEVSRILDELRRSAGNVPPPGPRNLPAPPPSRKRAKRRRTPDWSKPERHYELTRPDVLALPDAASEATTLGPPPGTPPMDPPPWIRRVLEERPRRYANARVQEDAMPLQEDEPLPLSADLELILSIGPLDPRSQVRDPTAFPTDVLPPGDHDLDVVVSSTHVLVALSGMELAEHSAQSSLHLPADGPAIAPDGENELQFALRTPDQPGFARIRISYYFHDAVVQSQVLDADCGIGDGFTVRTDFTASRDLTGLERITDRPRISIITNTDPTGNHQITVRSPSHQGGSAVPMDIEPAQLTQPLRDLRRAITQEEYRPAAKKRSQQELIGDLQRLARPGAALYEKVLAQARMALWDAANDLDAVIHIARVSASTFTLPWMFLYDFPLAEEDRTPETILGVPVCERVKQWDGKSPLVEPGQRRCPNEGLASHTDSILCPFGFWGIRYRYEIVTSSDDVVESVSVPEEAPLIALVTTQGITEEATTDHLTQLRQSLARITPTIELQPPGHSKEEAKRLLGADIPLVYCLCHGERPRPGSPDTYLAIGDNSVLTASRIETWLNTWDKAGLHYWSATHPLVFINACHSVELSPETVLSYVEAFVGAGRAAGVIGTEAPVHYELAMDFAATFYRSLTDPDPGLPSGRSKSVGDALAAARLEFLRAGNLFGLLYAPYCRSDLHLSSAPSPSPRAIRSIPVITERE